MSLIEFNATALLRHVKEYPEFIKDIKEKVIQSGLDDILKKSTEELKSELLYIINEKIRNVDIVDSKEPLKDTNRALTDINIPKSDSELMKHFFNLDTEKVGKDKDYTKLNEPNMLFVHKNKGEQAPSRLELRIDMEPGDTVEDQHAKARDFFNKAVFAFTGKDGKSSYFVNPGIDLTPYIKIKCSTHTGFGDEKTSYGVSPAERFKLDSSKGYATWTLKQEAVERIINGQMGFINVSNILEAVKAGEFDTAKALASQMKSPPKEIQELPSKVDKLEKNEDLAPSVETYNSILSLVRKLKIVKEIKSTETIYSLITEESSSDLDNTDFIYEIEKQIALWKVTNENLWLQELKNKINEIIQKFESRT